ncbi:MAG: DUF4230 domain-containing protein [Bacteroidota bacterium]
MMTTRIYLLIILLCLAGCQDKKRGIAISTIKSASKLATTEVTLSKMIFASQEKRFLHIIRLNEAYFAARTEAIVKAGVDLEKLGKDDVLIEGERITISLPPVKVIDFAYPFEKYKIDYSITDNAFGNVITIEEHEKLYRQSEVEIRRVLPDMGIKEATERNTRVLLEGLLKSLGYTEVYISFKPGVFIDDVPLSDNELQ